MLKSEMLVILNYYWNVWFTVVIRILQFVPGSWNRIACFPHQGLFFRHFKITLDKQQRSQFSCFSQSSWMWMTQVRFFAGARFPRLSTSKAAWISACKKEHADVRPRLRACLLTTTAAVKLLLQTNCRIVGGFAPSAAGWTVRPTCWW